MKFQSTTDFQVEAETGEATRVPTLEEEEKLNEFLEMVDFHNITQRKCKNQNIADNILNQTSFK